MTAWSRIVASTLLAACGGNPAVVVPVDAATDASSEGGRDAGVDSGMDSGTDSGMDSGCSTTPPELQCALSAAELVVCFEHAAGCPGDVVDVGVFVRGPEGCENTLQATGTFATGEFALANPRDQNDPIGGRCIRRDLCGICSPPSVDWAILRGDAVGVDACPMLYPIGRMDTIQLEIPADLAPGDYPLAVTGGRVFGIESACGSDTRTILGPTITVVEP
ncbi:MAG: hypothetical protein AAGE52_19165 [Myxococcota bacterium]